MSIVYKAGNAVDITKNTNEQSSTIDLEHSVALLETLLKGVLKG